MTKTILKNITLLYDLDNWPTYLKTNKKSIKVEERKSLRKQNSFNDYIVDVIVFFV